MASDQREAALKPCPFCGGDAGFEGVDGGVAVVCLSDDCGATLVSDPLSYHEPHVAAAWNRRAPAPPTEAAGMEGEMSDVQECHRCNGSGEVALSVTTGRYVAPGPVPDDAKGVVASHCRECSGMGYVEVEDD